LISGFVVEFPIKIIYTGTVSANHNEAKDGIMNSTALEGILDVFIGIDDNQVISAVDYFNAQFQDLNIPLGWVHEPVILGQNQACRFLPLGENVVWGFKDNSVPDESRCLVISNAPANASEWNLKIMGILFSAFAAAQGAPFWFDILKKFVNIRGSGKSPDEKTK
jgi:hypothetical protein